MLEKIKAGHPVPRIVKGLFHSVVKRILEMDTLTDTVVLTGGVIEHNPFLAELIKRETGRSVLVPPHPQITGALGRIVCAGRVGVLLSPESFRLSWHPTQQRELSGLVEETD